MSMPYAIRWLEVEDAADIAAVESRGHPHEHRMGEELIRAQLEETADGRNLSLGLCFEGRLVGFILAFVMRDRREISSFFEAPVPEPLDASQKSIYVADYVVEPEHRRVAQRLSDKLRQIVTREELRPIPIDAFSTEEYAEKWTARKRFFSRLDLTLAARVPFHDAKLNRTLYWLCFERIARPLPSHASVESTLDSLHRLRNPEEKLRVGVGRSEAVWNALQPWWDELLNATPHACVFQTWEFLRTWSEHLGAIDEPYTMVALQGDRPVAVAPMQVVTELRGKKPLSHLVSIGEGSTGYSVPLLHSPDAGGATEAIARQLAAHSDLWNSVRVDASEADEFLARLSAGLQKRGCPVSVETGFVRHRINVSGSWGDFFAGRPASVKEAFEQSQSRLQTRGELRFDLLPSHSTAQAIEQYFELESNAPDDEIGRGASASSRHTSFYRALATRFATTLGMRIGFLSAGDKLVAGLMGFQWRGRFFLPHATRTETCAPDGAAIVMLGRFIQLCFEQRICDALEISASGCPEASGWANRSTLSVALQAQAASVLRRFLRRPEPLA